MAMLLFVVAAALVVGLARGGSLRHVGAIHLRAIPLVVLSLLLQVILFTPLRQLSPMLTSATPLLYIVSMGMLVLWVALNWQIAGMGLMALGLLCNTLAITANGGYMPVSEEGLRISGRAELYAPQANGAGTQATQIYNNSALHTDEVHLYLLTDIVALPAALPFANVFSVGDLLLAIGGAWCCYYIVAPANRLIHQQDSTA